MDTTEERSAMSPGCLSPSGAFSNRFRPSQQRHFVEAGRRPSASSVLVPASLDYVVEAAEAKLVDYRGEKMAAFEIDGETMICLPQAYDLFLKYLVGGLHTVYTKLKRLEITPFVCNVEQVRALRSIGAIQPGVNRCKLISRRDFDVLHEDCASSNSKPGRPPKRNSFYGGAAFESENCYFKKQKFASLSPAQYVNKTTLSEPTNGVKSPASNQQSTFDGAFAFGAHTVGQQPQGRGQYSAAVQQQFLQFYPFSTPHLMHLFAKQWAECGGINYSTPVALNSTLGLNNCKDETVALQRGTDADNLSPADCGIVNLSQAGPHADDAAKRLNPSDVHSVNAADPCDAQLVSKQGEHVNGVHSTDCANDESDSDDSPGREHTEDNSSADDAFIRTKIFDSDVFSCAQHGTGGTGLVVERKPGREPEADRLNVQSPYSSVHNLLLSITRLVEITAAAARKSEEQLIKEKMEVYKAYEEEKREKARIEKTLREEQKSKLMYMKRCRLAKKQRAPSMTEFKSNPFVCAAGITDSQTNYQNHSLNFGQELVETCNISPTSRTQTGDCCR